MTAASWSPVEGVDDLMSPRLPESGPWMEAWYALVRPADAAWFLWLRYTLSRAPGGDARAHVWAIAHDGRDMIGHKRPAGTTNVLSGGGFHAKLGTLTGTGATGDVGEAAWDLEWEQDAPPYTILPYNWMLTGPLPRHKLATPVPSALASGEVRLGDARHEVEDARVTVGHTWGRGHAAEWAWSHGQLGDATFEAVTGSPLAASPPVTVVRLRKEGVVHHFTDVRTLVGARSEWEPGRWDLRARHGSHLLVAEVRGVDGRLGAIDYEEPSGGHRVNHAGPARLKVSLRRRGHAADVLEGDGFLEVGSLARDPRVPHVL